MGTSARIGFTPQFVASGVGGDYNTLSTSLGAAKGLLEGFITTGYLPSLQATNDPWIKLFTQINEKYNAGVTFDGNVLYGMNIGYLTVQALQAAGKELTVKSLFDAIEKNGFKGPGLVPLGYSKTSHSGYMGVRLSKVTNGVQDYFGPAYTTDAADAPVKEYTEAPATPPANGIPPAVILTRTTQVGRSRQGGGLTAFAPASGRPPPSADHELGSCSGRFGDVNS
jgi:hypothetical protein